MPPKPLSYCTACELPWGPGVVKVPMRTICRECFQAADRKRYAECYSKPKSDPMGTGNISRVIKGQAAKKRRNIVRRYMMQVEKRQPIKYEPNYLNDCEVSDASD